MSLQDAGSYYCSGDNGLGHVDKEELILDVQYGPEVNISAVPIAHMFISSEISDAKLYFREIGLCQTENKDNSFTMRLYLWNQLHSL